jgi:hypothetical protein
MLLPLWPDVSDTSDASRLFDLDGLAVERFDLDAFGGRVVHVVTREETASACPSCGVFSTAVRVGYAPDYARSARDNVLAGVA